jgi:hypothetical protein
MITSRLFTLTALCYFLLLGPIDAYAFLGMFGDSTIESVQEGVLDFDRSTTVKNALEGNPFLMNPSWKKFETSQKRTVVEFAANINFLELKDYLLKAIDNESIYGFLKMEHNGLTTLPDIKVVIQFLVHADSRFELSYLSLFDRDEDIAKYSPDKSGEFHTLYRGEFPSLYANVLFKPIRNYAMECIWKSNDIRGEYQLASSEIVDLITQGRLSSGEMLFSEKGIQKYGDIKNELKINVAQSDENEIHFNINTLGTVFASSDITSRYSNHVGKYFSKNSIMPAVVSVENAIGVFNHENVKFSVDNNMVASLTWYAEVDNQYTMIVKMHDTVSGKDVPPVFISPWGTIPSSEGINYDMADVRFSKI